MRSISRPSPSGTSSLRAARKIADGGLARPAARACVALGTGARPGIDARRIGARRARGLDFDDARALLLSALYVTQGTASPAVLPALSEYDQPAWRTWWECNRDAFREYRTGIVCPGPEVSTDGFFLGHSHVRQSELRLHPVESDISQVADALRALAGEAEDSELVGQTLIALARIGSDDGVPLVPRIVARMHRGDPELQRDCIVALAVLAEEAGVAPLVDLLIASERGRALAGGPVSLELRAFAAYGLARIGYREPEAAPRVVEALRGVLSEECAPELEVACVQALGLVPCTDDLEVARFELLLALAQDGARAPYARGQAALGLCRGFDALPATRISEWTERVAAAEISWVSSPDAPAPLRRQATLAVGALAAAVDSDLRARLAGELRRLISAPGQDETLFGYACLALAESARSLPIDDAHVALDQARFLVAQLDGPLPRARWAALACGRMAWELDHRRERSESHAEALAVVRGVLDARLRGSDGNDAAFVVAARLAGSMEGYTWALRELAGAPSLDERTLELVDWLGDRPGRARLIPVSGSQGKAVEAAHAALSALQVSARRDPDSYRCVAAARSELEAPGLTRKLMSELHDADTFLTRIVALEGLAVNEDVRSLAPLLAIARDASFVPRIRSYAVAALGELCDKEGRPWNLRFAFDLDPLGAPETLRGARGIGVLNYR
jgi:hypothetical protein